MTYTHRAIQYRMQPCSKVEGDTVTLLPMSKSVAQDALTDMVLKEIIACKTVSDAREIERNLRLLFEHTDMEIVGYMGQVRTTIKRLEQE